MATGKKYYWIKIKESFMTSDKVDFLMSQKNGANYIVLYQMLCLKTINTNGELCRELGEVIIPFDEYKIQRDCKYFEIDTIRVAFELYKKLGMIYVNSDNMLQIADFNNMVGFETDYATQKRVQRSGKSKELSVDRRVDRSVDKSVEIVNIDIRDKILDIDNRYKNKDKDKELDIDSLNNNTNIYNNSENEFKKPTLDEIQLYADSIKTEMPIDCERFYDHYESVGWYVGKAPMVDWKAMVRKWGKRQKSAKELEMEKSKLLKEEEQEKELTDEDIERIEKLRQRILEKQEKLKEEDDESIEDIRKSLKEKWKK